MVAALACGAMVQWCAIGGRVMQAMKYTWKFGEWQSITAGREALLLFVLLAGMGVLLASGMSRMAGNRREATFCRGVSVSYAMGLATWIGLIASPLVELTR